MLPNRDKFDSVKFLEKLFQTHYYFQFFSRVSIKWDMKIQSWQLFRCICLRNVDLLSLFFKIKSASLIQWHIVHEIFQLNLVNQLKFYVIKIFSSLIILIESLKVPFEVFLSNKSWRSLRLKRMSLLTETVLFVWVTVGFF